MLVEADSYQVGGSHYRNNVTYQHWTLVHRVGLCYFAGNSTKYVCRWRKKNGGKNGVEDLKKALHYLNKLEEISPDLRVLPKSFGVISAEVSLFNKANQLGPLEGAYVAKLATWADKEELDEARQLLFQLIDEAEGVGPQDRPVPLTEENHYSEREGQS